MTQRRWESTVASRGQEHTHFGAERPGVDLGDVELTGNTKLGDGTQRAG
jgi:hypothetical protein